MVVPRFMCPATGLLEKGGIQNISLSSEHVTVNEIEASCSDGLW